MVNSVRIFTFFSLAVGALAAPAEGIGLAERALTDGYYNTPPPYGVPTDTPYVAPLTTPMYVSSLSVVL